MESDDNNKRLYAERDFEKIGHALLARTRKMWRLIAVLVGLNFFSKHDYNK